MPQHLLIGYGPATTATARMRAERDETLRTVSHSPRRGEHSSALEAARVRVWEKVVARQEIRAPVAVGAEPDALGKIWHVPTVAEQSTRRCSQGSPPMRESERRVVPRNSLR